MESRTAEEINALNARVATEIMGWPTLPRMDNTRVGGYVCNGRVYMVERIGDVFAPDWSPATSIGDAWSVVEKMRERSHRIEVDWIADRGVSETWKCGGKTYMGLPKLNPNPKPHYVCSIMGKSPKFAQCWEGAWGAKADTAPMAICLAALQALPDKGGKETA